MKKELINVHTIPLSQFFGFENAEKEGYIFKMEAKKECFNHLGIMHAAALFSLAEGTSGQYLLDEFKDFDLDIIPVVRKAEVKYSKPGNETVYSKAKFLDCNVTELHQELTSRKRVNMKVQVNLFTVKGEKIMSSVFDWFVAMA